MSILQISDLVVQNKSKNILKDFNLQIEENQIHVIMGPNGSGKSTLAKTLAGHPDYIISNGRIDFLDKNLQLFNAEMRSKEGLFMAFQAPPEISGLTNFDFLHLIYNEHQKHFLKKELSPIEFLPIILKLFEKLNFNKDFLYRNLNEGFSGGEKKKNEILQLLILNPKLIILDEIDSGLDIDALKQICMILKSEIRSSLLVITHNSKIIDLLNPDFVHIFFDGKIQKTGGAELANLLDQNGYNFFI